MHLTQERDFSQTCGFNRIIKVIMVHDLKPKKYKHQLFFLQNQKNHIFEVLAGIIPIKIL